jgi:hypothetical protein
VILLDEKHHFVEKKHFFASVGMQSAVWSVGWRARAKIRWRSGLYRHQGLVLEAKIVGAIIRRIGDEGFRAGEASRSCSRALVLTARTRDRT